MKNAIKFIVALVIFMATFVAHPLAGGGPYAEGAVETYQFDTVLFSNSSERGGEDELIVALNHSEKRLLVLAHGTVDGSFWKQGLSSKAVVDTLIDGLIANGKLQHNDFGSVWIICCYPGAQAKTVAACGAPIVPCSDIMDSIFTTVTSNKIIVRYK